MLLVFAEMEDTVPEAPSSPSSPTGLSGGQRGCCRGGGGTHLKFQNGDLTTLCFWKSGSIPSSCVKSLPSKTVYPHPYWPYRYHPAQRWTLDLHRDSSKAYTILRLPNCSFQCVTGNVLCFLREGGHYVWGESKGRIRKWWEGGELAFRHQLGPF